MKVRILTALAMAVLGVPILVFSEHIFFSVAAGLLCLCCVWEMLRVMGLSKKYAVCVPSYIIAAVLPIFGHKTFFAAGEQLNYILIAAIVMFMLLIYLNFVAVFSGGTVKTSDASHAFAMLFYIIASFVSIVVLRYIPYGNIIYLMVFLIAWVSDGAAYFVGTFLGKHKLAPEISPKKTVEGAIGGVIFAIIGAIVFGVIVSKVEPTLAPNYLRLALIGGVLSVIAQLGDLWASLIKREYGVKDYSNILPGHGGIFDRFDSVLAVCVPLMIASFIFNPFGI